MTIPFWLPLFVGIAGMGVFLAIALSVLLRKAQQRNVYLSITLLLVSLEVIHFSFARAGFIFDFPHLIGWPFVFGYCYGPLLLAFVLPDKWPRFPLSILHFLPALLLLTLLMPFPLYSTVEKAQALMEQQLYVAEYTFLEPLKYLPRWWYLLLHQSLYAVWIAWQLKRETTIAQFNRLVLWGFVLYIFLMTLYFVTRWFPALELPILWHHSITVVFCFVIYGCGIAVFRYTHYFHQFDLVSKSSPPSAEESSSLQLMLDKATILLTDDLLFTQPKLRLAQVSELVGLSSHELSRAINHGCQKGFNEWINDHRIRYAKQELLESDKTIKEVAYAAGFNNLTSFYTAFKSRQHCTPKAFRQDHQRREV